MDRICAWCKKKLPSISGDGQGLISHGICPECAAALIGEMKTTVRDFLDTLDAPVFLVDADGRMVSANRPAQAIVGKDRTGIENRLGGDVFECKNASLPGGCGKTEHCRACAIRNSVLDTLDSGKGVLNEPAVQQLRTPEGIQKKRFLISTEKVGAAVLLRIDSIE